MTIFLILAPYGVFRPADAADLGRPSACLPRAAICLAVIAYDIASGRSVKDPRRRRPSSCSPRSAATSP